MRIDWQTYAVHSDREIKGFFGDYRFLSNFHVCPVFFDGGMYSSSEAAYMAAKTSDAEIRKLLQAASPKEARALGQKLELRPGWDKLRIPAMFVVVFDKFSRNADIRRKLIDTRDAHLEERNAWGDMFWGVDWKSGAGGNHLGKILMKVRGLLA